MTLKEIRTSKGLLQNDAAKIVGVSLRTYKRIENDVSYFQSKQYNEALTILCNCEKFKKVKNQIRKFNVLIIGKGYVGSAIGNLLSKKNNITYFDINSSLVGVSSNTEVFKNQNVYIISTPTDFNEKTKTFDVSSVLSNLEIIYRYLNRGLVVIKSTVPIGFMDMIAERHPLLDLVYMPEFLRENTADYDANNPDRVIVGYKNRTSALNDFINSYKNCMSKIDVPILYMNYKEAESVKLFSNAYLAMRVAFFNELDSFAMQNCLDSSLVINGVCKDNRIGDYYNNPSFGYGGYCLPKDSKMLSQCFSSLSNSNLVHAIVDSNKSRKEYLVEDIIDCACALSHKKKSQITIGIYKLGGKKNSTNIRSSSSVDILNMLKERHINVLVFDTLPNSDGGDFLSFINKSDLVIANRYYKELKEIKYKVYTRDIYFRD